MIRQIVINVQKQHDLVNKVLCSSCKGPAQYCHNVWQASNPGHAVFHSIMLAEEL